MSYEGINYALKSGDSAGILDYSEVHVGGAGVCAITVAKASGVVIINTCTAMCLVASDSRKLRGSTKQLRSETVRP